MLILDQLRSDLDGPPSVGTLFRALQQQLKLAQIGGQISPPDKFARSLFEAIASEFVPRPCRFLDQAQFALVDDADAVEVCDWN